MAWLLIFLCASLPKADFPDVILRGATVYDGSGLPGVVRDVALKGDRIVVIAQNIQSGPNTEVIDLNGLILAPGFIDLHTHSDDEILHPKSAISTISLRV